MKTLMEAVGRERTPAQPGPARSPPRACARSSFRSAAAWTACSPATTARRSPGVGSELYQVRPYEPGDDVRRIEWNVTARTGETHVRVELAERVLVTWLVLDASASMAFGTADRRKADVAEGVALAVGHAATPARQQARARRVRRRGPALAPAAAGAARAAAHARGAPRGARRAAARLGEALALVDGLAVQRSLVVDRLGLPRADRLAQSAAAPRRPASDGRGRDPRSARAGARRRRRAAARRPGDRPRSFASTRATARCASASPPPRPRSGTDLVRMLASAASRTSRSRPRATGCAPLAAFLRAERPGE